MGTYKNPNEKAQYAHLKRDILGDGIKESKLAAIEKMYAQISGSGSSGGSGSTANVYGIIINDSLMSRPLTIYRISNPNNLYTGIINHDDPSSSDIIFEGTHNNSTNKFVGSTGSLDDVIEFETPTGFSGYYGSGELIDLTSIGIESGIIVMSITSRKGSRICTFNIDIHDTGVKHVLGYGIVTESF